MKKLLLTICLLLCSVVAAQATEITVSSSQWPNFRYSGTVATLRVYYNQPFLSSTNVNVVGGAIGSSGWFVQVSCTVDGSKNLNCASFTLESTIDSNKPNTRFFAVLYDQSGARRETLMGDASGWTIPASPTTTTVAQLQNAQGTGIPNPPVSYLNSQQVQTLINTAVGTLSDAGGFPGGPKGRTYLSVAPALASNPKAVGDNDPRVPTQAENDALVGTSGTPSSSNKYVTNIDTTAAATASSVVRRDGNKAAYLNDLGSQVFNVKAYGAVGDGVTDDTAAISLALTACLAARGILDFPGGSYLVNGSGAYIFLITKPIQIQGDGMYNSIVLVKSTTGATTDIFYYAPAVADVDSRGFAFRKLGVNYQSATHGRVSLTLDGSTNFVSQFDVADSFFGLGAGISVYIKGPASGDGVFTGNIDRNFMLKAPYVESGGDTLRFRDNSITGPATNEFYIALVPGATTLLLDGNNITPGGGTRINSIGVQSGVKVSVTHNIFENSLLASTGSNGGLLNLTGAAGAGLNLYGVSIFDNQFGSVGTSTLQAITSSYTTGMSVRHNTYCVPVGAFFLLENHNTNTDIPPLSNTNICGTGTEWGDNGGANVYTAPIRTVTGTNTVGIQDTYVRVTSGTFTLTLSSAATRVGKIPPLIINNPGAGTVTIDAEGTETINGSLTYSLTTGKYVQLIASSATTWDVVGSN